MLHPSEQITSRLQSLRTHLAEENPVLVDVVAKFEELDRVGYKMGLLHADESFATMIAWWPMVAVLGTFSAGKSTFINRYLGTRLQLTGNQAVDDKFTVVTFSHEDQVRTLPGLALDADPRFPFYQISEQIEKVATGEGGRINSYLQLKTCPTEKLKGRILIDSPGFDADEQRNAILRITDHIIDLSDLVLVFFDARHPEPGAMQDTLKHLVADTIHRKDANKVLFILNQIDVTAREDNVEEVVAAWQRALARGGLASGRFYTIFDDQAAVPIEDEGLKKRYQKRRDVDLDEIEQRISNVTVERAYRVVGALEHTANAVEYETVPALHQALMRWKKGVIIGDLLTIAPLLILLLGLSIGAGYWDGLAFVPPWIDVFGSRTAGLIILGVILIAAVLGIHFWIRKLVARYIARGLKKVQGPGHVGQAFLRNTRFWHSIFMTSPMGWTRASRKRVAQAREAADRFVQQLNDRFTNPSGGERTTLPVVSTRITAPRREPALTDESGSAEAQNPAPVREQTGAH